MDFFHSLKREWFKKIMLLSLAVIALTGCAPTKMNTRETSTEKSLTLETTREEKFAYDENINYEDLTNMIGKNILFSGYVEVINEGANYSQLKVTFNENKNDLVYVKVSSDMMLNIEVGEHVLVGAVVEGEYSFNDDIFPSVTAKEIETIN